MVEAKKNERVNALKEVKSLCKEFGFTAGMHNAGGVATLSSGHGHAVSSARIKVSYGAAALSLQSQHHRAEHWVIVQGAARVMVDVETRLMSESNAIYIPLNAEPQAREPQQTAHGADRGAVGRLFGRGRYRAA